MSISVAVLFAAASVACVQVGGLGSGTDSQTEVPDVAPSDSPVLADAATPEPSPTSPLDPDAAAPVPIDHDARAREACVKPLDLTDDDKAIAITLPPAGATAAIEPGCIRLKKGKSIRFQGDLVAHPFEVLHLDGTPVPDPGKGVEANALRIDEVGTFLVQCRLHAALEHTYVVVVP
jgi:hypothetical protein